MGRDTTELNRDNLLDEKGHKCRNCERRLEKEDLELHHIVPREAKGQDSYSNITVLCRDCHEAVHIDGVDAPDEAVQTNFDDYEAGGEIQNKSGSTGKPDITDYSDESG